MTAFADSLVESRSAESLDLPIISVLSERLLSEADENGDISQIIRQMDARIGVLYGLMNMANRLKAYPEIAAHYRKLGETNHRYCSGIGLHGCRDRYDRQKLQKREDPG